MDVATNRYGTDVGRFPRPPIAIFADCAPGVSFSSLCETRVMSCAGNAVLTDYYHTHGVQAQVKKGRRTANKGLVCSARMFSSWATACTFSFGDTTHSRDVHLVSDRTDTSVASKKSKFESEL